MPILFPRTSIRLRLLLASTVVQVLLLTVLLANSVRLVNEATSASLDILARQTSTMLHALAQAHGEPARHPALQAVLDAFVAQSGDGLIYVRITTADGRVLMHADQTGLASSLPAGAPVESGASRLGQVLHRREALRLPGGEAGVLQFGISASPFATARTALIEQGSAIALAEILLTLALVSVVGYLLTRKLGQLLTANQALARGDLDYRLPTEGADELTRLARHFNAMAASMQARIEDLQECSERLRASEQRHALALRGADDGLWDWDIESDTVYCSPRYIEIAGLPPERSLHRAGAICEHIHPSDAENYRRALVEHLKGASPQFSCEYRLRQLDGGYRWAAIRGMALRGGDGRAFRMTGVLTDVQARRLAAPDRPGDRSELPGGEESAAVSLGLVAATARSAPRTERELDTFAR